MTEFKVEVEQEAGARAQALTVSVAGPDLPDALPSLRGIDHFDTYWGPLTHPFTFANAQPLQCGYPAVPPKLGGYFTVADTVPTPPLGEGV